MHPKNLLSVLSTFLLSTFFLPTVISAAGPLPKFPNEQTIILSDESVSLNYSIETESNPLKVPGANPAYHCSDPSNDLFQIASLMFYPTNPTTGYYFFIEFWGDFTSATGGYPWLNITGVINGRPETSEMYYYPLCDIEVWQEIDVPWPAGDTRKDMHRAWPGIQEGYTQINAPPILLVPYFTPVGEWEIHAEATTQDGRRIFCVEGIFNVSRGTQECIGRCDDE